MGRGTYVNETQTANVIVLPLLVKNLIEIQWLLKNRIKVANNLVGMVESVIIRIELQTKKYWYWPSIHHYWYWLQMEYQLLPKCGLFRMTLNAN